MKKKLAMLLAGDHAGSRCLPAVEQAGKKIREN